MQKKFRNWEKVAGPAWEYITTEQKVRLAQMHVPPATIEEEIAKCFHQTYPTKPNHFLAMLEKLGRKTPKYLLSPQILTSCHTRIEKESLPKKPRLQPKVSVINAIIQAGLFDYIPKDSLQDYVICAQDGNGDTALHYLARTGEMSKANPALITEGNMLTTNNQGATPLYVAVTWGLFDLVPKKALTARTLAAKPGYGEQVITLVATKGQIHEIPITVLKDCNTNKVGHTLAKHEKFSDMPKQFITRELLLFSDHVYDSKNPKTKSTLSLLAGSKEINIIPNNLLSPEDWVIKNSDDSTPLSHAVIAKNTAKIPVKVLTPQVLLAKCPTTNFSNIVASGQLAQLPNEAIVKDLFPQKPELDPVILDIITSGQTNCLPKDVLQHALNQVCLRVAWEGSQRKIEVTPIFKVAITAARGNHDVFFGLDVPESYKSVLGEEWWATNEAIKQQQKGLNNVADTTEIDLF